MASGAFGVEMMLFSIESSSFICDSMRILYLWPNKKSILSVVKRGNMWYDNFIPNDKRSITT